MAKHPNRLLQNPFFEQEKCGFPKEFEGRFSKTRLFQQTAKCGVLSAECGIGTAREYARPTVRFRSVSLGLGKRFLTFNEAPASAKGRVAQTNSQRRGASFFRRISKNRAIPAILTLLRLVFGGHSCDPGIWETRHKAMGASQISIKEQIPGARAALRRPAPLPSDELRRLGGGQKGGLRRLASPSVGFCRLLSFRGTASP
jgi:hypothetical protein